MKIKFERDSLGCLWHGIGKSGFGKKESYYNLGFLAVDWHGRQRQLIFYFWKWGAIIEFEKGKGK